MRIYAVVGKPNGKQVGNGLETGTTQWFGGFSASKKSKSRLGQLYRAM